MSQGLYGSPVQWFSLLIGFDRSSARYPRRRPDDTGLLARLRALAAERRRFGYRRLGVLLAREGLRVNPKKLYRLYREERLAVRRRWRPQAGARHTPADGRAAGG